MLEERFCEACVAIRTGHLDQAEAIAKAATSPRMQAACLNLLGVIEELRGNERLARKYFRQSFRAGAGYSPAERNLRRLYELATLGKSQHRPALGDERPALETLLRDRSTTHSLAAR